MSNNPWLPITTAPQNDTPVDLWRDGERLTNMRRVMRSPDNIYYEPVVSGYCCVRDATHWMPIPLPPTDETEFMSTPTYADMVKALAKPGQDIVRALLPRQAHLLHMVIGISGEAGELLDAVKKSAIYRKPLDRENVVEELGDLEFYMEGLRQGLGITREETLEANIKKLGKRYEGFKYSDKAAQLRADKDAETK